MKSFSSLLFSIGLCLFASLGTLSVRADEKAEALLKEVEKASKAAGTMSATLTISRVSQGQTTVSSGTLRLKQPNFARVDLIKSQQQIRTIASDGKILFLVGDDNQCAKMPASTGMIARMLYSVATPSGLFFDAHSIAMGSKSHYAGSQTIDQTKYEVVELNSEASTTVVIFINPASLVTRVEFREKDQTEKEVSVLSNVKTGQALADASFAYTPPKTAKLIDPTEKETSQLIPVGTEAPNFSLPTLKGDIITLSEVTKSKKAVLVNFWPPDPAFDTSYPFPLSRRFHAANFTLSIGCLLCSVLSERGLAPGGIGADPTRGHFRCA